MDDDKGLAVVVEVVVVVGFFVSIIIPDPTCCCLLLFDNEYARWLLGSFSGQHWKSWFDRNMDGWDCDCGGGVP